LEESGGKKKEFGMHDRTEKREEEKEKEEESLEAKRQLP